MLYRVKNSYGNYCNIFHTTKPNHFNFSKPDMVGQWFGTTDINVANEYRDWLESIYPSYQFTVVEASK